MSEEQATSNEKKETIGPIEAYDILLRRQISEDRIIVERTSIFLLSSSFLFLAYVGLLAPDLAPIFSVIRIILPIIGLFLTILICNLNLKADNALSFFHGSQRKIEETAPEFAYMRDNEITPHLHGDQVVHRGKRLKRICEGKWLFQPARGIRGVVDKRLRWAGINRVLWLYIPGAFFVLWLAALIVAILNLLNSYPAA